MKPVLVIMLYLTEADVQCVIKWSGLVVAVERALAEISAHNGSEVPPRNIIRVDDVPLALYTMPCYSKANEIVSCKLVSQCPNNEPRFGLPSITSLLVLFNIDNGQIASIMEAETITEWRTTAGSIVATLHLCDDQVVSYSSKTLAILGMGKQGKIHTIGFQKYFKFKRVNIWDRNEEKARSVAEQLQSEHSISVHVFMDVLACVSDADIIIWCGSATKTIYIRKKDIKQGVFIISVGTSPSMPSGIGEDIFRNADLFTESVESARTEMGEFITENELEFREIGSVILNKNTTTNYSNFIVYQSLGSAILDAAAGKFILENWGSK